MDLNSLAYNGCIWKKDTDIFNNLLMHGWLADKEGVKAINSFLDRVEESIATKAGNAIDYLNSTEQSEKIELEEESH
jgi:hypothetical protein